MTDYLEPRQGENEDALWEAVRRLEEGTGTAGQNPSPPAEQTTEQESGKAEGSLLPLLEEMEILERVQAAASSERERKAAGGRGSVWLDGDIYRSGNAHWGELPQAKAGTRFGGEERTALLTGAPLPAEQLDQMFRRDSRRYDSGFFLY